MAAPPPPRRFTGRKHHHHAAAAADAADAAADAAAGGDGGEQGQTALKEIEGQVELLSSEVTAVSPRKPSLEAAAASAVSRNGAKTYALPVDDDIALKAALAASSLPTTYNLEVAKTVCLLRRYNARRVCLQLPEGLAMFALPLSDIFESFVPTLEQVFVLGDVTYGACCVDDHGAALLGCDFLVHYGHSCLVPVDVTAAETGVRCMYVFVEIDVDVEHLMATIEANFDASTQTLALAGTIQFTSGVHEARSRLATKAKAKAKTGEAGGFTRKQLPVPQAKPLSMGEVLGCTAPKIPKETNVDALIFVADGRFHLEAIMIANPEVPAFRYDPYTRKLTREEYDQRGMREARRAAVEQASTAKRIGVILGTLGRQGSPAILRHIESRLRSRGIEYTVFLMSEIAQARVDSMHAFDAWIQICCPRLSIDWGEKFSRPLLSSYEAEVALGFTEPWWYDVSNDTDEKESHADHRCCSNGGDRANDNGSTTSCCSGSEGGGRGRRGQCTGREDYPMDYYAASGGPWNSSWHKQRTS